MLTNSAIKSIFPDFESELVDQIQHFATLKSYEKGASIMRTGQYFKSVMIIVSGLVKIYREDDEGKEYFMYYLQPGQACALSMICATRNQVSQLKASASENTEVIMVPLEYMDAWMNNYKSWYYFVLENYRSRFQELLVTLDHTVFRNMDERLLYYLKRRQQTLKADTFNVNYTEIAQELNSSREVISRLMKKLSENESIRILKNNEIKILHLNID